MRHTIVATCVLTLASCTSVDPTMTGTRIIPLNSERAFERMMDDAKGLGLQRETAGAETRYVATLRKGDPAWDQFVSRELTFAETLRFVVEAQPPKSLRSTQHYNGDAIVIGSEITLEPVDAGQTKVAFRVIPASGPRASDYSSFLNACRFAAVLNAVGKLDAGRSDSAKAEEAAAYDLCTKESRALTT